MKLNFRRCDSLPGVHGDSGESEDSSHAQGDSVRGGLPVQPEAHPGEHHDQSTGEIHLRSRLSIKIKIHFENFFKCYIDEILKCICLKINSLTFQHN